MQINWNREKVCSRRWLEKKDPKRSWKYLHYS